MKKKPELKKHSCTIKRRKYVRSETWNIDTGEKRKNTSKWVTEECGTPLFGNEEQKTGVCKSCKTGWNNPENYMVDDKGNMIGEISKEE